jgi:cell filamentation protein, protein adenylyltransferase
MATTVTRAYRQSHPWIRFEVDLRQAPAEVWMLLGEARSKIDHLSRALLKPEVAREMNSLYLPKGAHATTAIEGNTLSEDEVVELLEGRLETPPSQEYLAQEVMNIVNSCNGIKIT